MNFPEFRTRQPPGDKFRESACNKPCGMAAALMAHILLILGGRVAAVRCSFTIVRAFMATPSRTAGKEPSGKGTGYHKEKEQQRNRRRSGLHAGTIHNDDPEEHPAEHTCHSTGRAAGHSGGNALIFIILRSGCPCRSGIFSCLCALSGIPCTCGLFPRLPGYVTPILSS